MTVKTHRLRKRYGHAAKRKLVHNLDELYAAIDGKKTVYEGIPVTIEVERRPYVTPGYPGRSTGIVETKIILHPTAAGKRTEAYREKRREYGDDWMSDVTDSETFWTTVVPRFVDDSGIRARIMNPSGGTSLTEDEDAAFAMIGGGR